MIAEETTRTWQYLDSLRHFGARRPPRGVRAAAPERPRGRGAGAARLRADPVPPARHRAGRGQAGPEAPAARLERRGGVRPPLPACAGCRTTSPRPSCAATTRCAARASPSRALRRACSRRALAWGGWNAVARLRHGARPTSALSQQMNALNREYDEITRSLPSFGVGGSTMRDAVTFYNGSIRGLPDDHAISLVPISGVLGRYPAGAAHAARVAGGERSQRPAEAAQPTTLRDPRRRCARSARPRRPRRPARGDPGQPAFRTAATRWRSWRRTVRVPTNDFRGALDEVRAPRRRHRQHRRDSAPRWWRARSTCGPRARSQGRHQEREPASMEARFVLRIVRERAAPHEPGLQPRGLAARCAAPGCCSSLSIAAVGRASSRAATGTWARKSATASAFAQRLREARARVEAARRERDSLAESADVFRTLVERGLLQIGAPPGPGRAGERAARAPPALRRSTTRSPPSARCRWPAGAPSSRWTCSRAA